MLSPMCYKALFAVTTHFSSVDGQDADVPATDGSLLVTAFAETLINQAMKVWARPVATGVHNRRCRCVAAPAAITPLLSAPTFDFLIQFQSGCDDLWVE